MNIPNIHEIIDKVKAFAGTRRGKITMSVAGCAVVALIVTGVVAGSIPRNSAVATGTSFDNTVPVSSASSETNSDETSVPSTDSSASAAASTPSSEAPATSTTSDSVTASTSSKGTNDKTNKNMGGTTTTQKNNENTTTNEKKSNNNDTTTQNDNKDTTKTNNDTTPTNNTPTTTDKTETYAGVNVTKSFTDEKTGISQTVQFLGMGANHSVVAAANINANTTREMGAAHDGPATFTMSGPISFSLNGSQGAGVGDDGSGSSFSTGSLSAGTYEVKLIAHDGTVVAQYHFTVKSDGTVD